MVYKTCTVNKNKMLTDFEKKAVKSFLNAAKEDKMIIENFVINYGKQNNLSRQIKLTT